MTEGAVPAAERARLIGVMDQYLDALAARRPQDLRLAPHVRNTENTRALPVGTGLWRTVRGRRKEGHYFVDTVRSQIEFWGAVTEHDRDSLFGVRLRAEGRTISEIETIVVRGSGGDFFNPDVVCEENSGFHRILPPEERGSREALVAIADRYFDAIELSDGSRLPVEGDCRRLVNGTLDSVMDADQLGESDAHRALSVAEQMDAGHYAYIEALRDRRYPIVDEERGIVIAHLLFDHPGDLPRADGDVVFPVPNTMMVFEAFKICRGVLEEVWAIGGALPYGIDSGWPR
ncbi:MAG TPA: hypothetical protein VNZ43_15325 [Sphingomonadaceae bacterium]|nr:hypothetical protein [Sphingomonadaceae bacterium]